MKTETATSAFGVVASLVAPLLAFVGFALAVGNVGPLLAALVVAVLGAPRALFGVWRIERPAPGTIHAHATARDTSLDLRGGFVLEQMKVGRKNLRLKAGGKSVFLRGFGTLDEVDQWLKEAQVAV